MFLFRKNKEAKPNVPSLHFSGWGYDDREDANVYREEGTKVLVVEAEQQTFILRKLSNYVFFRRRDEVDERVGWFLLEPCNSRSRNENWLYDIKKYPPAKFAEAHAQQAYGRCLLYVADCMHEHQCVFLCFAPDGTGFAIDYTEERLVDFNWQEATPMAWAELRTATPEALQALCKIVFDTLVHPRLTNPYIDPDSLKEIPHEFISGSEQELRRVTTLIIQSDSEMFAEGADTVTVIYRAQTPTKRGYMIKAIRGEELYDAESITQHLGRLQSLCDLALRLNPFTGVKWETWEDNPNRLGHFQKQVHSVSVTVHSPSAHERAESLLSLSDWLEGKVRDQKRLRLLGVEEG